MLWSFAHASIRKPAIFISHPIPRARSLPLTGTLWISLLVFRTRLLKLSRPIYGGRAASTLRPSIWVHLVHNCGPFVSLLRSRGFFSLGSGLELNRLY